MRAHEFESRFVDSRTRSAIDAGNSVAETGSLFEVEHIRAHDGRDSLRWVGYVWLKDNAEMNSDALRLLLDRIGVGGERCYGMGRLRLEEIRDAAGSVFGFPTNGDGEWPCISVPAASGIPAHLRVRSCGPGMRIEGEIEPLQGRIWDAEKGPGRTFDAHGPEWCWTPGSRIGSSSEPSGHDSATTMIVGGKGVLEIANVLGAGRSNVA